MTAPAPISYSITGAASATGLSRSYLNRAICAGRLRAKKSGIDADGQPVGNWVITAASLSDFIEGLADA